MPKKITYFAMVDELSSRDEPAGVLRRIEDDQGQQDETFTRNLKWEYSWSLYSYERGNRDVDFYEIGEDEANRIVICQEHGTRVLPRPRDHFAAAGSSWGS